MLLWNCIGGGVLVAWNLIAATIHFMTLDRLGVLRVTADDEIVGLDVPKHHEPAYGFGTGRTTPPSFLHSNPNHNVMTVSILPNNKVDPLKSTRVNDA